MSTPIDDGGPAYPCDMRGCKVTKATEDRLFEYSGPMPGMTLRDYFAGQALANSNIDRHDSVTWAERVADQAYCIADAMIAARKGGPQS